MLIDNTMLCCVYMCVFVQYVSYSHCCVCSLQSCKADGYPGNCLKTFDTKVSRTVSSALIFESVSFDVTAF